VLARHNRHVNEIICRIYSSLETSGVTPTENEAALKKRVWDSILGWILQVNGQTQLCNKQTEAVAGAYLAAMVPTTVVA
jgi:hypothetical protein